jgi:hypothetical protein
MHIVCATGFYLRGDGILPYWRHATVDEIADLYVREIEQGIDGTDIRAGLLNARPARRRSANSSAAARPPRRSRNAAPACRILTHTEAGQCGPDQQDLFESHGVPLNRCLIGHSCGNPDHAYHLGIAKRGSFVGFDRIGNVRRQSDDIRAENVVKLIEAGHAERVMLSQTATAAGAASSSTRPGGTHLRDRRGTRHRRLAADLHLPVRYLHSDAARTRRVAADDRRDPDRQPAAVLHDLSAQSRKWSPIARTVISPIDTPHGWSIACIIASAM